MLSLGCGSSGSSIPVTGNFNNSSLKGNYEYQLFGVALDSAGNVTNFAEAGVFVADGNGHITSGTDDFNQSGAFSSNAITGNYTIGKDGNGIINFTLTNQPAPNTFGFAVTMLSTSKLYVTEADLFANGSGEANLQDTTKFASAPGGTFVMRAHTVSSLIGSVGTVGALTFAAPNVTGSLDVLRSKALSQVSLTSGNVSVPDATGRGTLTIKDSGGITSNYKYYVIDGNTVALLQTDGNVLSLGRCELQSAGPFALSGSFAFGSSGDTATVGFARTVGVFTSNGGGVTGGTYDSAQDQTTIANQNIAAGTVTGPDSRGRALVTFQPSGGNTINEVFWMVSSSRAFFVVNDPNKVEDGTADLQTTSSFSNSTLKGQYALVNDGFNGITGNFLTRVGTLIPDGNGNLSLNEWVNAFTGSQLTSSSGQVQITGGAYQFGNGGRVTAALPSLSNNLVLYMVSPSQAYMLQNDAGVEISGKITLQTAP